MAGIMSSDHAACAFCLYDAAINDEPETLVSLLEQSPEIINAPGDDEGGTALHIGAWKDRCNIVGLLLDRGANLNLQDTAGFTPLLHAARDSSVRMVDLLLSRGADPTISNMFGVTPLMIAAGWAKLENVRRLLQESAVVNTINAQDKDGETALHRACNSHNYHGNEKMRRDIIDIVQLLLDNGGDPSVIDNDNCTALDVACEFGPEECITLMGGEL